MNPSSPPIRILCVDDEPAIRTTVAAYLGHHGYDVHAVEDGETAWRLLSEQAMAFAVVITDNQMPNLTGVELIAKLRAHGYAGRIIFFCSSLTQLNLQRLQPLRVSAIVQKGRPATELLEAVQQALAT